MYKAVQWRFGAVVTNNVALINKVTLRQAHLVLSKSWLTIQSINQSINVVIKTHNKIKMLNFLAIE